MIEQSSKEEARTKQQIREHYECEKELANRLRNAPKNDRRELYSYLYEELFRLVPHHPQLTRKKSPSQQREAVRDQMILLGRLLNDNTSFLEIGPGDCALAFHVAKFVKKVYAVDVSRSITESSNIPSNFRLFLSNGSSIPVPRNTVNVAYSYQLIEHLHPDDAYDQLINILEVLVPGGVYLCITPNRLTGPHDISRYFDSIATGFHLKEYTVTELSALFTEVGFSKVRMYVGARGKYAQIPVFPAILGEFLLNRLPDGCKRRLVKSKLMSALLRVRLLGIK